MSIAMFSCRWQEMPGLRPHLESDTPSPFASIAARTANTTTGSFRRTSHSVKSLIAIRRLLSTQHHDFSSRPRSWCLTLRTGYCMLASYRAVVTYYIIDTDGKEARPNGACPSPSPTYYFPRWIKLYQYNINIYSPSWLLEYVYIGKIWGTRWVDCYCLHSLMLIYKVQCSHSNPPSQDWPVWVTLRPTWPLMTSLGTVHFRCKLETCAVIIIVYVSSGREKKSRCIICSKGEHRWTVQAVSDRPIPAA